MFSQYVLFKKGHLNKGAGVWTPPGPATESCCIYDSVDVVVSVCEGEMIEIRTRTHTQLDWWEGAGHDGRLGIFPANYVQLL